MRIPQDGKEPYGTGVHRLFPALAVVGGLVSGRDFPCRYCKGMGKML